MGADHDAARPPGLTGRVALVTGAGRGIGRAIALALAARGAAVALVARTAAELDVVAAVVRAAGGQAAAVPVDLGRSEQLEAALSGIVAGLGEVDVLVNNAGTLGPVGPTGGTGAAAWTGTFEVDLFAPVRLTLAVLPGMRRRGWGRILNVSSGAVAVPEQNVGLNAYVAAKSALEAHTLNLAAELAGSGVTANVLRPGLVRTGMHAWMRAQPPDAVGAGLHAQFAAWEREGALRSPELPAAAAVELVCGGDSGRVVDVGAPAAR